MLAFPIRLQPEVHEFDIQTVQLGLDSLLHHIVYSTKFGTLDALCVRTCVWSVCVCIHVCVCKCLNSFFLQFFVVVKLVPWRFGLCLDIICCIFSWLSQFVGHFVCFRLASVSWEVVQCNPGFWKTSLRRDHLSLQNTYWNLPIMFPCKWTKDCSSFKSAFTETFIFQCKWMMDHPSFKLTFTDTFSVKEQMIVPLLSQLLLTLSCFHVNESRTTPLLNLRPFLAEFLGWSLNKGFHCTDLVI